MPKVVGYDQTVYKRTTCQHCGAINEYTPNELKDIKGDYNHEYLFDYEVYKGFNCAGCGKEIFVNYDDQNRRNF